MSNKEKSLYNVENYNKTFDYDDISEYINKYSFLIKEYINLASENIFIQNPTYYKFIIERGIETLQHIYSLLVMYTKNIDLVFFHCQKAYYYYIEFIGQIGNDSHSFLQLNSKDATLFVYKKTICDINPDYRKKMELSNEENLFIETVKNATLIYNKIFYNILDGLNITCDNKNKIESIAMNTSRIYSKLIFECDNLKEYNNKIKNILYFIDLIVLKEVDNDKVIQIIELIIKKVNKNPCFDYKKINSSIYNSNFDILLQTHTPNKIVNWIFTNSIN